MFVFVPAVSGAYTVAPQLMRKEYGWWRDDAIVRHPAMLISYGMKFLLDPDLFNNIKKFLGYDLDKLIVIADSGGFEIHSRNETIPVEEVLSWQFENANIIIALDMPPRGMRHLEDVKDWEKCKLFTRKNTEALIKYASTRKAENRKIYGVVHGITLDELDDWWHDVIEPFYDSLDGICYAVRPPNNPKALMLSMAHAYIKGVKNVHMLGISGTRTFIPLIYWQDRYTLLTADSSSFTKISGRGRILMPMFMKYVAVGMKGKVNVDYSELNCPCPACQYARKHHVKSVYNYHNTNAYFISYLHNLFWQLAYIDGLKWLLKFEPKAFIEYATSKQVDMSFLDCLDEHDINVCYNKYMHDIDSRSVLKNRSARTWW